MLRLVSMDEQGKRVRIPDGTAAVYVESILVDENQSLGKPEKAEDGCGSKNTNLLRKRESEDLQKEEVGYRSAFLPTNTHRKSAVAIIIVTAFYFAKL